MANQDDTDAKRPKIEMPDDFDDEASFLEHIRKEYRYDVDADKDNRDAGMEDLAFAAGEQWDDDTREKRIKARKPVLTVNRLPAFIAQIVGNRRMNETTLRVIPDVDGTKAVARVREGLMRSIQKLSRAEIAYDKALENCVITGIGNFSIDIDYDNDDVFDQAIRIKQIPDPYAVVWDREIIDPTGADAGHVFVDESISREEFKKTWPWATPADLVPDQTIRNELFANGWITDTNVRVTSFWRMRSRKRMLALFNDGSTRDITNASEDVDMMADVTNNVVTRADGSPIMREVERKYAEMYVVSGTDVLEGPYQLDISRVPVFRVPGWELMVGVRKIRWGLVRFLKDPQRMHNYWRSAVAEKIMQSPRGVWTAADSAVAGRETQWRNSHLTDDPLLIWNAESGQKPERVPPSMLDNAMLTMSELTQQDIKDVSNIHEANLGMPSNEVSGAAIMARQRVSDTGSVLYHDNLNAAIEQAGVVIDQLIPTVYDTPRIIKVLGEDAKQDMQAINDTGNPQSVDITAGKYQVSVVTGPSYATKRIESLAGMMSFINAMPQVASAAADLIAEAQDWPKAQEIAQRLRMQLPPGMVDTKDMEPDELKQYVERMKSMQAQAGMEAQAAQAKIDAQKATAAKNLAQAQHYQAETANLPAKQLADTMTAVSEAEKRELDGRLAAINTAEGN